MLKAKDLAKYENWVGKSAAEIQQNVKFCSGWKSVFPSKVPQWANRIRNYFNHRPNELELLPIQLGEKLADKVCKFTITQDWRAALALTDYVYREGGANRYWYQMKPESTIYHRDGWGPFNFLGSLRLGQKFTEIFKLVSPDGTGGSYELCLLNTAGKKGFFGTPGGLTIGKVGASVNVRNAPKLKLEFKGSYNYSETVDQGYPAHEKRDINPHEVMTKPYIDIGPLEYKPLERRIFPEMDF